MSAQRAVTPIGAREPKLLTIGQVLNLLKGEFAELTNSKLRFIQEQGLVNPQRTEKGYRKYSSADVDRVRLVLQLQRDSFMPHKVIKDYLDDLDAGRQPNLPATPNTKALRTRTKKLSALDLVNQSGINDNTIAAAQDVKLIGPGPFGVQDVEIAKALVELQKFGLTPRHLNALRVEAEREIGIIEGVIKPVLTRNDTSSRARAEYLARLLQELFNTIRNEVIDREISKIDPNHEG